MLTLEEFISKWLGKKADYDNAYGGQCVDLFRFYVKEVLGLDQPKSVGGAKEFWSNYETDPILNSNFIKIKNTPEGLPESGDVMLWSARAGDGYGHVAIFLEGDLNKFTSLDQNWPTVSKCTKTEHTYTNVLGWLRPNINLGFDPNVDIPGDVEIALGLKDHDFYDKHWTWLDFAKDWVSAHVRGDKLSKEVNDTKDELKRLRIDLTASQAKVDNQAKEITMFLTVQKDLKEKIAETDRIMQERDQLSDAINKLLKEIDDKDIEINKLKDSNASYIAGTSVLEAVSILITAIINKKWSKEGVSKKAVKRLRAIKANQAKKR